MMSSNGLYHGNGTPSASNTYDQNSGNPMDQQWWKEKPVNGNGNGNQHQNQHQHGGDNNNSSIPILNQSQPHFLSTPSVMTPQLSMYPWPPGTPPSVGDPPVTVGYAEAQRPPPPPPLHPGQLQHQHDHVGHPSTGTTQHIGIPQLQMQPQPQYSCAQHRFDQIFMTRPVPPPPPPRPPPLVPQQILRKTNHPSPRRPFKKRKQESFRNAKSVNKRKHPRESSEPVRVVKQDLLPFQQQQQSKEATIVSLDSFREESSTTEIFTTFNVKYENSQVDVDVDDLNVNSKHHEKSERGTSSKSSSASMASSTGTTEVESSEPTETAEDIDIATKTSESRKKLELLKAQLELANQKKLAMQGELKQTSTAPKSSAIISKSSEPKKNSEEVQALLRRARERLRGAITSRERALQRMTPVQTPISGLSVSLTIKNISQTGPEDKVYFPGKNFGIDLGRKALEDLSASAHDSLATRRSQLQQELMALKERLERKQKTAGRDIDIDMDDDENETKAEDLLKHIELTAYQTPKQVMTKEDLERRKEEAQAFMDLSYWKHFVSKQEHIMSEVDGQVNENSKALEECTREIEDTTRSLQETDLQILDLETRQQAVASMVSSAMTKLFETRNKLHLVKAKE